MNAAGPLLGLVVAGLAVTVLFELRPRPEPAQDGAGQVGRAAVATPPGRPDEPAVVAQRVATLLARPLFSQTRRPPEGPGSDPGAERPGRPLPRMTGILIDGPHRHALFVAPNGGKPISVAVGGKIGSFTVETIDPQQVIMLGPEGRRAVHTSFDPNPPPPVMPLAVPPPVLQPVQPPVTPPFPGIGLPTGTATPQFPPGPPGTGYGAAR